MFLFIFSTYSARMINICVLDYANVKLCFRLAKPNHRSLCVQLGARRVDYSADIEHNSLNIATAKSVLPSFTSQEDKQCLRDYRAARPASSIQKSETNDEANQRLFTRLDCGAETPERIPGSKVQKGCTS